MLAAWMESTAEKPVWVEKWLRGEDSNLNLQGQNLSSCR